MSIKDIENQIILHSSSLKGQDIVRCQVYLELRKKLLDSQVIDHFDKYVGELTSFNERLTVALKTMWADAHDCFDKQKACTDYVIETKAYVELDYDEAVLDDNQIEIYSLLSDSTYNPLYREGVCISALLLRNNMEPLWESFDDFIGNDGKSWNEGLPYESTKDIPLTMMFHHLYDHTLWSLTDIIKIQHFNVVLNTTFEKTI